MKEITKYNADELRAMPGFGKTLRQLRHGDFVAYHRYVGWGTDSRPFVSVERVWNARIDDITIQRHAKRLLLFNGKESCRTATRAASGIYRVPRSFVSPLDENYARRLNAYHAGAELESRGLRSKIGSLLPYASNFALRKVFEILNNDFDDSRE